MLPNLNFGEKSREDYPSFFFFFFGCLVLSPLLTCVWVAHQTNSSFRQKGWTHEKGRRCLSNLTWFIFLFFSAFGYGYKSRRFEANEYLQPFFFHLSFLVFLFFFFFFFFLQHTFIVICGNKLCNNFLRVALVFTWWSYISLIAVLFAFILSHNNPLVT